MSFAFASRVVRHGLAAGALICSGTFCWAAGDYVTTWHYNNQRTGWNSHETVLNTSNVNNSDFGLLWSAQVDSRIEAQPLYATAVTVATKNGPTVHNVVYVFTVNNFVYAFDARGGGLLLKRSLGAIPTSAELPLAGVGGLSTPVIDPASQTLYVLAFVSENNQAIARLFALNLSNLQDKLPSVIVSGSNQLDDGSTIAFDPTNSKQRAALLEANGNIYAAFAGRGEAHHVPSHGWLLGWNASTLAPLSANILTNHHASVPGGCSAISACLLTSIWMSGAGPAADASGNVYVVTGNSDPGSYGLPGNFQESVVKFSPDLSQLVDYFTPYNENTWDQGDVDLGSGGVTLIPQQKGAVPFMAVAAGKSGEMYLMNQQNLGGHATTHPDHVLGVASIGNCWCAQSYFTGADNIGRIVSGGGHALHLWRIVTNPKPTVPPKLVLDATSDSLPAGQDPGLFPTVSSNATNPGTAIAWVIPRPVDVTGATRLYAFDATNLATLGSWRVGPAASLSQNLNSDAVVANGRVIVGAGKTISVFGIGGEGEEEHPRAAGPADVPSVLPKGSHDVFGHVESVAETHLTIRTRDGRRIYVNTSAAEFQAESTAVGMALEVIGKFDSHGTLVASMTARAKEPAAIWPADR